MAKKDVTTDFDAESFLDTYREDAAPTYRNSRKPAPAEPPPTKAEKDTLAKTPVNAERTETEDAFLRTFVENRPVESFNKKGRQVMVVNEFRKKILKIQALFGEDCTIAQYVHNVLAKHFEDYDEVLQSLFKKSKQL